MGTAEESIREGWKAAGEGVLDTMWGGDPAQLEAMIGVAWTCLIRAHLHWGAIGAATVAMSFILLLVKVPDLYKNLSAIFMGLRAIIYPISWLYVANNLTLVGKAAKNDIHWLASIGIGALMIGTAMVIVSLVYSYFKERKEGQNAVA